MNIRQHITPKLSIAALLLIGTGATQASLVAHYKFDETTGTTAANEVSGATDGTINGATTGVLGKVGTAYSFDGTSNWVDAGNASFLPSLTVSGKVTFSAWINTVNAATSGIPVVVFAGDDSSSNNYIDLSMNNAASAAWGRTRTGNTPNIAQQSGDDIINDGAWHHLAWTIDTSTAIPTTNLYVDGVLDNATTTAGGTQFLPILNNFEIGALGRSSRAGFFNGAIDDVQVYDEALSLTNIQFLNNNPGAVVVPEPSSAALLGLGGLALILRRRK